MEWVEYNESRYELELNGWNGWNIMNQGMNKN